MADTPQTTRPTEAQCREAGLCLGNTRGLGCVCGAAFADGKPRPKTTISDAEVDAEARRIALMAASKILRAMAEDDVSVEELARRLGVPPRAVTRELLGRSWRQYRLMARLTLTLGRRLVLTMDPRRLPVAEAA